ncbi:MAG: orc1/cdc6 family replication initiation protein [Candidatus Aenigmarchaeota archaeon]|nr:orc1/cdc6 family replication initiation protein [Candidatus Aenigmarchaeota archaeon]
MKLETTIQNNIFSQYLQKENIFKDKKFLTSSFVPDKITHRDGEIRQIGSILAPVLKGYSANNIFIYGTCGTGKTICAKFIINQLKEISDKNGHKIKVIYVNCKMKRVADTEYRLFAQLLKELGEYVPDTGLPTDVLYRKFFEKVETAKCTHILILDEIDTLVKKVGDEFLYNFTRINQELKQSHLTIVGITNDLSIRDNLDLRVKSSLSEEEILFKPYNANQLKDILEERANSGFISGVIEEPVIAKCAAIAAQEHGDARRALDLLRVAGEIAERSGEDTVTEKHVDIAEQKIDLDRVTETVKVQPTQSQAVLYSIILLKNKINDQKKWVDKRLMTGDVFDQYCQICASNGLKSLTQRRVSDLISELDMLGIINAKVISNGRHGRTREIIPAMNETVLGKVTTFLSEKFSV